MCSPFSDGGPDKIKKVMGFFAEFLLQMVGKGVADGGETGSARCQCQVCLRRQWCG